MALVATGLSTHIFNNHVKSTALLLGFPVLLLLMLGTFCGAMGVVSSKNGQGRIGGYGFEEVPGDAIGTFMQNFTGGILQFGHWMFLAAFVWFIIAYFFHGSMMRMATGSQPVTRQQMPRIYNMLENLCISRGITMPQFEIIDSPALNAFATGINESTYKIVLTRGITERLSDDELEAVIAHELSHIMNRDVRLLIISVIFVGMISFFAELAFRSLIYGRRPSYYGRRSGGNKDGQGHLVILAIGLAILAVGYVFAIAIRFALSRKREYLADAGAVELTKNPDAMMRALLRISGNDKVEAMPDEVQQMCIENSASFMGIFATHPSINDRVKALSQMTATPVPDLQVSLRRGPRRPWGEAPE